MYHLLSHRKNSPHHLFKRGNTYYINIKHNGQTIRKSLKTDIKQLAQAIVENVVIERRRLGRVSVELLKTIVDYQVDAAIEAASVVLFPRSDQGRSAISTYYQQTIGATLHNMQVEDAEGYTSKNLSEHYKHVPTFRERQIDKLLRPSHLPQADENDTGLELHYEQPTQELWILDNYRKNIANALQNDDLVTAHNNLAALKQSFEIGTTSQSDAAKPSPTPTFAEALDQYIRDKSSNLYIKKSVPLSKKASDEKINYLSSLPLHLWKDTPIGEIDGRELDKVFWLWSKYPLTKRNPYKNMTIEERIEAAENGDVPPEQRVGKTLIRIKVAINQFFQHYWRLGLIDKNPISDMRFDSYVDGGERSAFTKAELKAFQMFAKTDLDGFKVPILVQMYGGARNSEISNIQPEDIKTEEGIEFLHIRGTKTQNAERYIPIHPKLVEFGVVDYIKNGGEIFSSQSITQRFNKLMKSMNIPTEDEKGIPRSFYSFRHNFASALTGAGATELQVELCLGHSFEGTKKRYISRGTEHLPSLAGCISRLSYD